MASTIIDIHLPGADQLGTGPLIHDARLNSYDRLELGLMLQSMGATVAYSRRDGEVGERGVPYAHLAEFGVVNDVPAVMLQAQGIPMTQVGAVRNTTRLLGHDMPELNPAEVRALAKDKVASNGVLADVGAGKAYVGWEVGNSIDAALDALPGNDVVLKPRNGSRGKGFQATTKRGAAEFMQSLGYEAEQSSWILEERLKLGYPMLIRGRDATQQAVINRGDVLKAPQELRAYCFGREEGEIVISYLMRVGKQGHVGLGNDNWVFVDTDSIPREPQRLVEVGLAEMEQRTGHSEMSVAFDFVFASRHGETEPSWIGMEINGTEPQLVTTKEDKQVGNEHLINCAKQLVRVAAAGGTTL